MAVKYQSEVNTFGSILYVGYNRSQDTPSTKYKFVLPKSIDTFAENVMVKRNDSFKVIVKDCATFIVIYQMKYITYRILRYYQCT